MIWYSPELDIILLITIGSVAVEVDPSTGIIKVDTTNSMISSSPIECKEDIHKYAWHFIGDL